MSYILEALKKSDKERQREEIPGLQVDHSLPPLRKGERKLPSLYLLGGGLIVFCGIGLFWWQLASEEKVLLAVDETPKVMSVPSPAQEVQGPEAEKSLVKSVALASEDKEQLTRKDTQVDAPITIQPAPVPAVAEKKSIPVKTQSAQPPAEQAEPVPPFMEELPVAIRAKIPPLSFAGHVYCDIPQKRLIIINNRIVREGDLVGNGLSLEKIGSDGVVLRYENAVFRVRLF